MNLTPTQWEVATLVGRGMRNEEIAEQLRLSGKTVEWHLTRVYRKLGVRSRTELVVLLAFGDTGGFPWVGTTAK